MEEAASLPDIDRALAQRLHRLRTSRGWSLDELARRSGVSRATLSRLERVEVSATAAVLGRLAAAFGLTPSRLLQLAEDEGAPLVRRQEQPLWVDPETGFRRRSVSPPAAGFVGEVIEGVLPAGVRLVYPAPPQSGLEHHLVLLEGALMLEVAGKAHRLEPGDCLRFRLTGANAFATPADQAARYLLFVL
ncbi:MAG: helix-turn-helix domain-containing protein [Pseudomonadota bacterium]